MASPASEPTAAVDQAPKEAAAVVNYATREATVIYMINAASRVCRNEGCPVPDELLLSLQSMIGKWVRSGRLPVPNKVEFFCHYDLVLYYDHLDLHYSGYRERGRTGWDVTRKPLVLSQCIMNCQFPEELPLYFDSK
jgi:hypothetical protein